MSSSLEELAFPSDDDRPGGGPLSYEALARDVASERNRADNLAIALESSRTIGMAMGILMNQHKVTADAAYDMLRQASQLTQRKLRDIADDVTQTGELPQAHPDAAPTGQN